MTHNQVKFMFVIIPAISFGWQNVNLFIHAEEEEGVKAHIHK